MPATKRWTAGCLAKLNPLKSAEEAEAYSLAMSTVPKTAKPPSDLAGFGYQYVFLAPEGRTVLRTIADPTKGFQWLGQKHYDFAGNAIVEHIYRMLEGGGAVPTSAATTTAGCGGADDTCTNTNATTAVAVAVAVAPTSGTSSKLSDVGSSVSPSATCVSAAPYSSSPPYRFAPLLRVMVPLSKEEEKALEIGEGIVSADGHLIEGWNSTCRHTTDGDDNTNSNNTKSKGITNATITTNQQEHNHHQHDDSSHPTTTTATRKSPTLRKTPRSPMPQVPIFMTPNALTCETLLVIMQGSGAVRPGMWARALCTNASLEEGTIFLYLAKATERGWGVIVTNPNENTAHPTAPTTTTTAADEKKVHNHEKKKGDADADAVKDFWLGTSDAAWKTTAAKAKAEAESVEGSESPEDHSQYVYNTFVAFNGAALTEVKHIISQNKKAKKTSSPPQPLSAPAGNNNEASSAVVAAACGGVSSENGNPSPSSEGGTHDGEAQQKKGGPQQAKKRIRKVLIVAHSYGGYCVGSLFRCGDEHPAVPRHLHASCPAIAFTDACNDVTRADAPSLRAFYKNNVVNWVASRRPLNTKEGAHRGSGCEERSAGHEAHEATSAACVDPLFTWLDLKLAEARKGGGGGGGRGGEKEEGVEVH